MRSFKGTNGAPTVALERPMSTERGMAYGGDPYGHGVLVVVRAGEARHMAKEDRCQRRTKPGRYA